MVMRLLDRVGRLAAAATMVVAFGLIFAVWLLLLGIGLLMLTLVGFVFEYYRGPFADA